MHSEQDRTQKLFNSLLRLPAKISTTPSPSAVHQLRTTIRRVETMLAVQPTDTKVVAKLLKQLSRLRRRAGKVRDLDVQIAALRVVKLESAAKDKERVMRSLNKAHSRRTKKLARAVVDALDHSLRKHLRRARVEMLQQAESSTAEAKIQAEASAAGLVLSALNDFAAMVHTRRSAINETTLHEFRTGCKTVRYKAEIAGNADGAEAVVAQLKLIQDAAGEWHDRLTLTQTAESVLSRSTSSPLIAALRAATRSKYLQALRITSEAQQALLAMREEPIAKKASSGVRKPTTEAVKSLAS